jgi:hypothetical protein
VTDILCTASDRECSQTPPYRVEVSMDYETRQAIMRSDAIRRAARDQADIDAFLAAKNGTSEVSDALPNAHRDIRASRKWADVQSRNLRGVASVGGRILPSDGSQTVAVYNFYARGVVSVVDHGTLRRKGRKASATEQAQTSRDSGAAYYARVASLGANTELASE